MYRSSNHKSLVHFADDTTAFAFDSGIINVHAIVNRELVGVDSWLKGIKLSLYVSETSFMKISKHENLFDIRIQNSIIRKFQLSNFLMLHLMKILFLMIM